MAALTQAEIYTQAGREPRSNPSTGENGSREGQVVHRCSMAIAREVGTLSPRRSVHSPDAASPSWSLPIGMTPLYDTGVSPSRREMVNTQVRGVHTRS